MQVIKSLVAQLSSGGHSGDGGHGGVVVSCPKTLLHISDDNIVAVATVG